MPGKKTLFVIGAGASKEANLPTGVELKQKIAELLDIQLAESNRLKSGDSLIYSALGLVAKEEPGGKGDLATYLRSAMVIRDGVQQAGSIDQFLEAHRRNEKVRLCGKLAIVRSILEAERRSSLYLDDNPANRQLNYESLNQTWYHGFMQFLVRGCTVHELPERLKMITLAVFNYDRCVEHFLYYSLQNYYSIDPESAADLVTSLHIHHPYGRVGSLPWEQAEHPIEFGRKPDPKELVALASGIRTFTEGTEDNASEVLAIKQAAGTSQTIAFLGFAFDDQNLQLLNPRGHLPALQAVASVFATGKGLSESGVNAVRDKLSQRFAEAVLPNLKRGLTCKDFFDEYRHSL